MEFKKNGTHEYSIQKRFEKKGKHIFTLYANGLCIAEYLIDVK
jgi:hypothetical protein